MPHLQIHRNEGSCICRACAGRSCPLLNSLDQITVMFPSVRCFKRCRLSKLNVFHTVDERFKTKTVTIRDPDHLWWIPVAPPTLLRQR